jgi:hypothetical protein
MLIKRAVQIITQGSNYNTSSYATSIHKFKAWNQNVSKIMWNFTKPLYIYGVYLSNKDMYRHAVQSLFHFPQIVCNVEIYHFSFKKIVIFP